MALPAVVVVLGAAAAVFCVLLAAGPLLAVTPATVSAWACSALALLIMSAAAAAALLSWSSLLAMRVVALAVVARYNASMRVSAQVAVQPAIFRWLLQRCCALKCLHGKDWQRLFDTKHCGASWCQRQPM